MKGRKFTTRRRRRQEEQLERQRLKMRAIGALDPYSESDADAVEQRIRNMKHGKGQVSAA